MCRQSERDVDVRVRMLLKLYADGQRLKQLLVLQAVARWRRHVIDSLQLRPGKSKWQEKENMIHG